MCVEFEKGILFDVTVWFLPDELLVSLGIYFSLVYFSLVYSVCTHCCRSHHSSMVRVALLVVMFLAGGRRCCEAMVAWGTPPTGHAAQLRLTNLFNTA